MAVVIELGEIGRDDAVPGVWRTRGEVRQRLLLVAAAGLILAWVAGAVPQIPLLGAPLWSTQANAYGFAWGPGTAYAIEPGGHAIAALDPDTGAQRWRVNLDAPAQQLVEFDTGVAVQLGPRSDAPATDQIGDLSVLLLGSEGRVIARVPGQMWSAFNNSTLLLLQPLPACSGGDCTQLSRVDPGTGTTAWSLPTEAHGYLPLQTCQDRTFAVAVGDTVQIRSLATAAVLSQMRVLDIENGLLQTGVLYGDDLVTAEIVKGGLVVSSHPVASTGPGWTITLPQGTTPTGVSGGLFAASCGGLLTAQLANSTVIIDRHTGAIRSQVPGDLFVVPEIGPASADGPDGPGVQLALSGPSATATRNVVLVLNTVGGTRVSTYPDTAILPWDDAAGRAMLTHESEGRTGFTALDALGRPRALGEVDGRDLTCRARADLLACRAGDGVVRVWRLPPHALP